MTAFPFIILGFVLVFVSVEMLLRQRAVAVPDPAPDPQATRIVVLGDSIAAGEGLAEGEAWPALLAARLARTYPAQRWQMINASAPGDTVADAYALFPSRVAAYQPHVVILALGINDCRAVQSERVERRLATFQRNERSLLGKSYLVRGLLARRAFAPTGARRANDPQVPAAAFADVLGWLARTSQRIHAQPVLLTLTPLDKTAAGEFGQWADYNAILRETARTLDAPFIEISHRLTAAQPWQTDGVHLSAAGQAEVADRVWQGLHRPQIAPALRLPFLESNAEMAPSLE